MSPATPISSTNSSKEATPNKTSKRPRGQIDSSLCISLLVEAYDNGAKEVGFYTTGEPLLHPDLKYFVDIAREVGYEYIYISTNGALLTPDRTKSLIAAGINSIKFSLDAATRDTYKAIHGKDDFAGVLDNIRYLKWRDKEHQVARLATFVLNDLNRHERDLAESKFKDLFDDIWFAEERNNWSRHPPCTMLFNRIHVTYDGLMTMCCIDYENELVVGDLKHWGINRLWLSDKAVDLRRKHLSGDVSGTLCDACLA